MLACKCLRPRVRLLFQVLNRTTDNHKDLLKANTSPGADNGTIAGGGLSSSVNRRGGGGVDTPMSPVSQGSLKVWCCS